MVCHQTKQLGQKNLTITFFVKGTLHYQNKWVFVWGGFKAI